jgi:hypothetical protein
MSAIQGSDAKTPAEAGVSTRSHHAIEALWPGIKAGERFDLVNCLISRRFLAKRLRHRMAAVES